MNRPYFYQIRARDHADLGEKLGGLFGTDLRSRLETVTADDAWPATRRAAEQFLPVCEQYFPDYLTELRHYAQAADADFFDLWTLSLEGEGSPAAEHCTTMVTNGGLLIGHTEDWDVDADERVVVLETTLGPRMRLELYYLHTLGGNAVSINQSGIVTLVNSLPGATNWAGVPRNLLARWVAETDDIDRAADRLAQLPRASSYNFVVVDRGGRLINCETSARGVVVTQPPTPFVHTNHFLSDLGNELPAGSVDSHQRSEFATAHVRPQMTVLDMQQLLDDTSQGPDHSLTNQGTIAKAVIDLESRECHVWLQRASTAGWHTYPLVALLGEIA